MADFMGYGVDEIRLPANVGSMDDLLLLDAAWNTESVNGDDLAILYRDNEDGEREFYEFQNGSVKSLADGDGPLSLRREDDYEVKGGKVFRNL